MDYVITYKSKGKDATLTFDEEGWWTSEQDPQLAAALNRTPNAMFEDQQYFPTPWHYVKAVAEKLNGTFEGGPEPEQENEKGVVY